MVSAVGIVIENLNFVIPHREPHLKPGHSTKQAVVLCVNFISVLLSSLHIRRTSVEGVDKYLQSAVVNNVDTVKSPDAFNDDNEDVCSTEITSSILLLFR